jgi:hypothetical protein
MGGVLTHTAIGLISGGIIYYFFRDWKFFLATLLGNTTVDFFKFFFAAIKQKTIAINSIEVDNTFSFWSSITNSIANWYTLGFFLITLFAFLYSHHIINKRTMFEYDEIIWAFLFGVTLHLIFDIFYLETNRWI